MSPLITLLLDVALLILGVLGLAVAVAGLVARRMTPGAAAFWFLFGGFASVLAVWPQVLPVTVLGLTVGRATQLVLDWGTVGLIYLIYAILSVLFRLQANQARIIRRLALAVEFRSPAESPRTGPVDESPRLAIVMPARDEAGSIARVLNAIGTGPAGFLTRTFVVDDGSTDLTAEVARSQGATVLSHAAGLGIGAALETGFEAAGRWKADYIMMIDADGQHPTSELARLLTPIRTGEADLVVGSRFLSHDPQNLSAVRRSGIRFYSGLMGLLTSYHVTDVTSGFRAFRGSCLDTLRIDSPMNWAIEMTLRAGRARLRFLEVPVADTPRSSGLSQFHDLRRFFLYHFRVLQQIYRAYAHPRPSSLANRLGEKEGSPKFVGRRVDEPKGTVGRAGQRELGQH